MGKGVVKVLAGTLGVFFLGLAVGVAARGEYVQTPQQQKQPEDTEREQAKAPHAAELAFIDEEPNVPTVSLAQAEELRDKWQDARGVDEKGELLWELTDLSYTEYHPKSETFKSQTEYFKGAQEQCKSPTQDCYVKLQKQFNKNGKLIEKFSGSTPSISMTGIRKVFSSSSEGGVEKEQRLVNGAVVQEKLEKFSAEAPLRHSIAEPVSVVYRRDKKEPVTTRGWVYDTNNKLRFFFTRVGGQYKSAKAFDSTGKVLFDRTCEVPEDCELS